MHKLVWWGLSSPRLIGSVFVAAPARLKWTAVSVQMVQARSWLQRTLVLDPSGAGSMTAGTVLGTAGTYANTTHLPIHYRMVQHVSMMARSTVVPG
jgi:hypothetical protein